MKSKKVTSRGAVRIRTSGESKGRFRAGVKGTKPKFLASISPRKDSEKNIKFRSKIKSACLLLAQLSAVAVVAASVWFFWPLVNRPVVQVELAGSLDRVDKQQMRTEIEGAIDTGLLTLDLKALSAKIEGVDWVYDAEVKKIWPQRLVIRIEEEQPVARWGDVGYLAASGDIVESEMFEDLKNLPRLEVNQVKPIEALELFYGLNAAMATTGEILTELKQSEFGSWSMVLGNGSEILLGREELIVRIQRVMSAWEKITPEQIDHIETIDARYPNGIAVRYSENLAREYKQINEGGKT